MRIQVAGFSGMLGHAVLSELVRRGHEADGLSDITSVEAREISGEVVINCAGIVKQRPLPASVFMHVNAYGPHRLAEACDSVRARLIHVSTDCVFNDSRPFNRVENTPPTPNDIYSLSKWAGEVTRWPHLTIRTSFVGWGKRGMLHELYTHQGATRVEYAGARWSGHTVETVASVLVTLAERGDGVTGLLHVPGEFQTRPQLIRRLSKRFNLNITVEESFEKPGYDRRLASERWEALGLPTLPDFETQLERMENP